MVCEGRGEPRPGSGGLGPSVCAGVRRVRGAWREIGNEELWWSRPARIPSVREVLPHADVALARDLFLVLHAVTATLLTQHHQITRSRRDIHNGVFSGI